MSLKQRKIKFEPRLKLNHNIWDMSIVFKFTHYLVDLQWNDPWLVKPIIWISWATRRWSGSCSGWHLWSSSQENEWGQYLVSHLSPQTYFSLSHFNPLSHTLKKPLVTVIEPLIHVLLKRFNSASYSCIVLATTGIFLYLVTKWWLKDFLISSTVIHPSTIHPSNFIRLLWCLKLLTAWHLHTLPNFSLLI